MNIGIVTTWFERGASYVSRQIKKVLESEHNVYIYARGGESYAQGDPNWDGPNVTWGKRLPRYLIDVKDFERWLRTYKIDLVLFNEQHSWPPVILCNKLGIITGSYVDYYTEVTIPLFACYDFLICNTKRHYSAFEWHPQCWYIPWGTDLDIFKPTVSPIGHEPIDRVRFFHSGGANPRRKGTDLVIQAFERLDESAHLLIHVQGSLRAYIPELGAVIDRLEADGRLTTVEKTVAAPGLYHLGDVYVYPTRLEGIGLTIAEALACGLPTITTNQPPMNEFVQPQENGQLVEVDRLFARKDGYYWPQGIVNLPKLQQAMHYYVQHADELTTFKAKARQYAEAFLDWRKNSKVLLTLLAEVKKLPSSETEAVSKKALANEPFPDNLFYLYPSLARFTLWFGGSVLRKLRGARLK